MDAKIQRNRKEMGNPSNLSGDKKQRGGMKLQKYRETEGKKWSTQARIWGRKGMWKQKKTGKNGGVKIERKIWIIQAKWGKTGAWKQTNAGNRGQNMDNGTTEFANGKQIEKGIERGERETPKSRKNENGERGNQKGCDKKAKKRVR